MYLPITYIHQVKKGVFFTCLFCFFLKIMLKNLKNLHIASNQGGNHHVNNVGWILDAENLLVDALNKLLVQLIFNFNCHQCIDKILYKVEKLIKIFKNIYCKISQIGGHRIHMLGNLCDATCAGMQIVLIQSFSYESPDQGPIAACIVKVQWYFKAMLSWPKSTPIFIVLVGILPFLSRLFNIYSAAPLRITKAHFMQ